VAFGRIRMCSSRTGMTYATVARPLQGSWLFRTADALQVTAGDFVPSAEADIN
jgi:hypothetical protein